MCIHENEIKQVDHLMKKKQLNFKLQTKFVDSSQDLCPKQRKPIDNGVSLAQLCAICADFEKLYSQINGHDDFHCKCQENIGLPLSEVHIVFRHFVTFCRHHVTLPFFDS